MAPSYFPGAQSLVPALRDRRTGLARPTGGGLLPWDYSVDDKVANFVAGTTWAGGSVGAPTDWFTATRAGTTKRAGDSAGTFTAFAANTLARTDKGLSIERGATNLIANSESIPTPGTPGTLPSGWGASPASGLSRQIVSTFIESGLRVTRYRYFGTAAGGSSSIKPGGQSGFAASTQYATRWYARLVSVVSGQVIGLQNGFGWYTGTSAYISGEDQSFVFGDANLPIGKCGYDFKVTSPANAAVLDDALWIQHSTGALDFTFDVATPIAVAGLPVGQPFTGTRNLDSVAIGGAMLTALQAAQGTVVLTLNELPADAVDCQILSINGTTSLLKRDAAGSLSTAWGGAQATAALPLQYWADRMQVAVSWNAGRVVIGASGVTAVGANNTPSAVTSALLGSLSSVALNGFVERMTITPTFMDVA